MAKLEELIIGSKVQDILPNCVVTVIEAKWHGESTIELTYKDEKGQPHTEILLRDREPNLEIVIAEDLWNFGGDGETLRLVSEAHRMSLLVKTVVAREQKQSEKPNTPINYPSANLVTDLPPKVVNADVLPSEEEDKPVVLQSVPLRRFHGSIEVDPLRMNRDADAIAKEVLQHLTRLKGATVKITLEIEAEVLDGVPDDVVRTVTENCNTLKFKTQGFERE